MENKYSIQDVIDCVDSEGLDYAVQHYLSYEIIEDPSLAALWKKAQESLDELNDFLLKEARKADPDFEWS